MISASPEFMKKERTREMLQALVIEALKSGAFEDDETREEFFNQLQLAITTLKVIPFEIWQKL